MAGTVDFIAFQVSLPNCIAIKVGFLREMKHERAGSFGKTCFLEETPFDQTAISLGTSADPLISKFKVTTNHLVGS